MGGSKTRVNRARVVALLREELGSVKRGLPEEIPLDMPLVDELGLDSLEVLDFVSRIEQRYKVRVPNNVVARLTTLDDVADYVVSRVEG